MESTADLFDIDPDCQLPEPEWQENFETWRRLPEHRLLFKEEYMYVREECENAIRGNAIPLNLGNELLQICTIRGMRYHDEFGEVMRGTLPVFTRSLNARQIMSNVIPTFATAEDIPYCIWHPDTASAETYRQLLSRYKSNYPGLAYQVGRACAVAGYTALYHELDILPDVHIAEEARESGNLDIYEAIVSQPVRYSIMNDYDRTIDITSRAPAFLNGDSAVKWWLDTKQSFKNDAVGNGRPFIASRFCRTYRTNFFETQYYQTVFNLTEDYHIDEFTTDVRARLRPDRLEVRLLSEALPTDLPTVQKDLLIAAAAYHGNIERYTRLRRPMTVEAELYCCLRGVLHYPLFAMWWSKQTTRKPHGIQKMVNARMIMNDILAGAPYAAEDTPYMIWWPQAASEMTYTRLAQIQPSMAKQILHACIVTGYTKLFDHLIQEVTPDESMIQRADSQMRDKSYFKQAIVERLRALGVDAEPAPAEFYNEWGDSEHVSSLVIMPTLSNDYIGTSLSWGHDIPKFCDLSDIEFMACLPKAWMLRDDNENRRLDYVSWPPGMSDEPNSETSSRCEEAGH